MEYMEKQYYISYNFLGFFHFTKKYECYLTISPSFHITMAAVERFSIIAGWVMFDWRAAWTHDDGDVVMDYTGNWSRFCLKVNYY